MRLPDRVPVDDGAGFLKRLALSGIGACAALILMGLAAPAPTGDWLLVVGAFAVPIPLIMIGAMRRNVVGPAGGLLVGLLMVLVGAGLGMLETRGAPGPWVMGLPLGVALQLYVACAVPLLVMPLAYALMFERHTLSSEDLERLRRRTSGPVSRS